MTAGAEQAIAQASRAHRDDKALAKNLLATGESLGLMGHYTVASALVGASVSGAADGSRALALAGDLKRMARIAEDSPPADDPYTVVRRFLVNRATEDDWLDRLANLVSHQGISELNDPRRRVRFEQVAATARVAARRGRPRRYTADMVLARQHVRREGDDTVGYRVRTGRPPTSSGPARTQHYFVVKEEGRYRLLDYYESSDTTLAELGKEVLERADQNRLTDAKTLLDWALDARPASVSADPLAPPLLHLFWKRNSEPDLARVREAAATLIMEDTDAASEVARPILETGLLAKASSEDAWRFRLALARLYSRIDEDQKTLEHGRLLLEKHPDSPRALLLVVYALLDLGRNKDVDDLLNRRLDENPDDIPTVRALLSVALRRNDDTAVRQLVSRLSDLGQTTASDLNSLAWTALESDRIDQEALESIDRAVAMTGSRVGPIRHTQAAVYAHVGRLSEAKEIAYRSMRREGIEEPNDSYWYVFGRMAEYCGLFDAARAAYRRVVATEPERAIPSAVDDLAKRRLSVLETEGVGTR
jgi:tetratricopeptide (TPR) repeat protein